MEFLLFAGVGFLDLLLQYLVSYVVVAFSEARFLDIGQILLFSMLGHDVQWIPS